MSRYRRLSEWQQVLAGVDHAIGVAATCVFELEFCSREYGLQIQAGNTAADEQLPAIAAVNASKYVGKAPRDEG